MPIVIFSIGSKILKKRNIEKIEVSARGEALCYCNVFYVESGKSINKYLAIIVGEGGRGIQITHCEHTRGMQLELWYTLCEDRWTSAGTLRDAEGAGSEQTVGGMW